MTDEAYAETRQNVTGRAKDVAMRGRDAVSVALMEVAAWDFFRWTVVALLAVNLLVMIVFFSGVKSSLAELKQDRAGPDQSMDVSAAIAKQMADVKAALTQSITDMQAGLHDDIAKINAKIDSTPTRGLRRRSPSRSNPPRRRRRSRKPRPSRSVRQRNLKGWINRARSARLSSAVPELLVEHALQALIRGDRFDIPREVAIFVLGLGRADTVAKIDAPGEKPFPAP